VAFTRGEEVISALAVLPCSAHQDGDPASRIKRSVVGCSGQLCERSFLRNGEPTARLPPMDEETGRARSGQEAKLMTTRKRAGSEWWGVGDPTS
jgi:hypothetical protein